MLKPMSKGETREQVRFWAGMTGNAFLTCLRRLGMFPPSSQVRRHVPNPVLLPLWATDLRIGTKSEMKHLEMSLSI